MSEHCECVLPQTKGLKREKKEFKIGKQQNIPSLF